MKDSKTASNDQYTFTVIYCSIIRRVLLLLFAEVQHKSKSEIMRPFNREQRPLRVWMKMTCTRHNVPKMICNNIKPILRLEWCQNSKFMIKIKFIFFISRSYISDSKCGSDESRWQF